MTFPSIARLLLIAFSLPAMLVADVSGKWTGTVVNERHEQDVQPACLILAERNGRLTGTAGPSENDQRAIENGRVDGGRVRFEMTVGPQTMSFDLRVSGNSMSGSITGIDASGRTERLSLRAQRR